MTAYKRIIGFIRDTWLILGISLLAFALLEAILALFVVDHFTPPDPRNPDVRANADAYKDVSWGKEYFEEFNESFDARWEPYVYWHRKPYSGKYITMDTSGRRVTPNFGVGSEHRQRVFMFGGSTMWGTGARDSFTIPAILAMELKNRGIQAEVINFGESGFVTTQEVIVLLRELQKGNVPDLVVFYDGINDTYSAYQQGVAGLAQNEYNRVLEFNLTKRIPDLKRMAAQDVFDSLATIRLAKKILGIEKAGAKPEYNARVAEEAVDLYLKNMEIVRALAASHKFQYQFFWQPTLFGKKNRSAYEKAEYNDQQFLERPYTETYKIIREKTGPLGDTSFHDISDIFQNEEEPVFIDWMHLSEKGNAMVAQAMANKVSRLLQPVAEIKKHNVER